MANHINRVSFSIILSLLLGFSALSQDSTTSKWAIELGVSQLGFGIRGQYTYKAKHRILLGVAYASVPSSNFWPIRIGYQYLQIRSEKRFDWIYVLEATYSLKTHVSPSRLQLSAPNTLALSDIRYRTGTLKYLAGFGVEFNLLKYFKLNMYPALAYYQYDYTVSYSNPDFSSSYDDGKGFLLGGGIGLVYQLPF